MGISIRDSNEGTRTEKLGGLFIAVGGTELLGIHRAGCGVSVLTAVAVVSNSLKVTMALTT